MRRISGRYQISADGKHLIDGVAFGRPFLRRADRPAIRIPPRKRRRITYDEEEENFDNGVVSNRQVALRAGFNDREEATAGGSSDDDEDFIPSDHENDEDLGAELEDLEQDLHSGASGEDELPNRATRRRSRRSPKGLGLLQLLDEDGQPFDGQYNNPLLDMYGEDESPAAQGRLEVKKRGSLKFAPGARKGHKKVVQHSAALSRQKGRRDSTGSSKSVRFEDSETATPATIRESDLTGEEDDDENYQPGEVDESDKENAEPLEENSESDKVCVTLHAKF